MSKPQRASTTEWCRRMNGLNEEIASLRSRIALLEAALIKIQNPLKAMQDEAKAQGYSINGAMAVQLCDSAAYLKEIASDALRATGHLKENEV